MNSAWVMLPSPFLSCGSEGAGRGGARLLMQRAEARTGSREANSAPESTPLGYLRGYCRLTKR
jgi:hypothetical protein